MQSPHQNHPLALLSIALTLAAASASHAGSPPGKGTVGSASAVWQDADDAPTVADVGDQSSLQRTALPSKKRFNYCVLPKLLNDSGSDLPVGSIAMKANRQGSSSDVGSWTAPKPVKNKATYVHADVWCETGVVGNGPPSVTITVSGQRAFAQNGLALTNPIAFPAKAAKSANLRALLLGISDGGSKHSITPKD